jgi:hypothetical protein
MIASSPRMAPRPFRFRALIASTIGGAILISGCDAGGAGGSGSVDISKAKEAAAAKGSESAKAAAARGGDIKGLQKGGRR